MKADWVVIDLHTNDRQGEAANNSDIHTAPNGDQHVTLVFAHPAAAIMAAPQGGATNTRTSVLGSGRNWTITITGPTARHLLVTAVFSG